jgi:uncharacterized protein (TIGR03118 family)
MMKNQWRHCQKMAGILLMIGALGMLGSCGGSSQWNRSVRYVATSLVSDGAVAASHLDVNLKNGWGIAFNPSGFVWAADNKTSVSTLYDGNGVPQSLVVAIPAGAGGDAAPTGIVFNTSNDFFVSQDSLSGKSAFIFVGEAGTVSAWSPSVERTNAVTVVDTGAGGAVYKGLALASHAGANFLYAADFRHRRIDVYDGAFNRANLPGAFILNLT